MGSALITGSLPVALAVVMFGLGLGLTLDDFRRVGRHPKAVVVALLCQLVLLPAVCFGLVLAFRLPPEPAVGMMLIAASPGGVTATLYSHLFRGNVALNLTLTAVTTAAVVVTLPVVVNLSTGYFLPDRAGIALQVGTVLQVLLVVLGPVAVGMLVRAWAPRVAGRLDRPMRVLSVVVLVAVISAVMYAERDNLASYAVSVGPAALAFTVVSLVVGYGAPRLVGVGRTEAVAAGFEIGLHNTALVVTIALSPTLLDSAGMAVPGAVYAIVMHLGAVTFGWLMTRRPMRFTPAVDNGPLF